MVVAISKKQSICLDKYNIFSSLKESGTKKDYVDLKPFVIRDFQGRNKFTTLLTINGMLKCRKCQRKHLCCERNWEPLFGVHFPFRKSATYPNE